MEPIRVLREDLVLVDWGPMTLSISAWEGGVPRPVIAARSARTALGCLSTLADFQEYLKKPVVELPRDRPLPRVVARARDAAAVVGRELTPLASVAGAVADEVADRAWELGADRVIVNNGGDIALRLKAGEQARVGIKQIRRFGSLADEPILGRLRVPSGDGVGGVASSGWQGRSHSLGLADLVTVWTVTAGLADAAATALANAVYAESSEVVRHPACELDPRSDLKDKPVVSYVGNLSPTARRVALQAGMDAAAELFQAGLIRGCLIAVQSDRAVFDPQRLFTPSRPRESVRL
ncbi:MAG: UPF0280 family protein [Deltaproteobacteria bacterium]|nr:UPF0280 family protein [Deltaproteobacteria bacterium]